MPRLLEKYWVGEDGAVTTDWIVLSASVVGGGLAVMSMVSTGVEDLAVDTSLALTSQTVGQRFVAPVVTQSFDNGTAGWTGTTANSVTGFGNILGPIQGVRGGMESVMQTFAIPEGSRRATFTFDLLSMDSLDGGLVDRGWGAGEGPVLYIDGVEVARARSTGGELHWTMQEVEDVTIESTEQRSGENIGGPAANMQGWYDGINTVEITVDDPDEEIRIGIGLNADQPIRDESIGIDNFTFETE